MVNVTSRPSSLELCTLVPWELGASSRMCRGHPLSLFNHRVVPTYVLVVSRLESHLGLSGPTEDLQHFPLAYPPRWKGEETMAISCIHPEHHAPVSGVAGWRMIALRPLSLSLMRGAL